MNSVPPGSAGRSAGRARPRTSTSARGDGRKIDQRWIEQQRIDVAGLPTGVEVFGIVLCRHEASIDIRSTTTSGAQRGQSAPEAGEEVPSVRRGAVACHELIPRGLVYPGGQVAGLLERRDHNTILALGCDRAIVSNICHTNGGEQDYFEPSPPTRPNRQIACIHGHSAVPPRTTRTHQIRRITRSSRVESRPRHYYTRGGRAGRGRGSPGYPSSIASPATAPATRALAPARRCFVRARPLRRRGSGE